MISFSRAEACCDKVHHKAKAHRVQWNTSFDKVKRFVYMCCLNPLHQTRWITNTLYRWSKHCALSHKAFFIPCSLAGYSAIHWLHHTRNVSGYHGTMTNLFAFYYPSLVIRNPSIWFFLQHLVDKFVISRWIWGELIPFIVPMSSSWKEGTEQHGQQTHLKKVLYNREIHFSLSFVYFYLDPFLLRHWKTFFSHTKKRFVVLAFENAMCPYTYMWWEH